MPQLWVVAGPNGAGKTTLVTRRLEQRLTVINPDTIAQNLPRIGGRLDERGAGELAIERRNALVRKHADLAIETTLSGNSTIRFIEAARDAGYKITLVYVGIASADLSAGRVADRVGRGGHVVPIEAIDRRYPDTMAKLARAIVMVDRAYVFDNSERRRRLLLIREAGRTRFLAPNLPRWFTSVLPDLSA